MSEVTPRTRRPLPDLAGTLAVLGDTMRKKPLAADRRIVAGDDRRSVDEGLAVLRCYVAIADRDIRQAILDVLAAAADPLDEDRSDPGASPPGGP